MTTTSFKDQYSFDERLKESTRIKSKYPDRIPVIVEVDPGSRFALFSKKDALQPLEKKKYLVPSDLTVGQFQYVIRQKLKIDSTKSLFIFINNTIPPTSELISVLYDQQKDSDGFVYFCVAETQTFG